MSTATHEATRNLGMDGFRSTAVLLATLGLALRLLAVAFFGWRVPDLYVVGQSLFGACLHLLALGLARRGRVDWAIFASGLDCAAIASLTPRFGAATELHLWAMLHPFLVLAFVRWPLRLRIFLALLPPSIFLLLRLGRRVPIDAGLLSFEQIHQLATLNVLVFVAVSLSLTIASLRLRDQAWRRAERLAEARSRLIDHMSHELRTPVAIQLTAAQAALERERSGEAYRDSLRVIERQARGLGKIVEKMLEMSRVEREEVAVVEDSDLAGAVTDIVESFRAMAAERGVFLDLETGAVAARTDSGVLRMVLANLLSNAIRFSPERGRVTIRIEEDGAGRRITVRDEGPGISAEDLPHVFERYWRGDKARSRRDGHLGLGLAIARRYARLLGAELTAESREGCGAALTMRWTPSLTRS